MTDAELVRYLDDELEGAAEAELEARIAAAPQAAARLDTLRRRSARLSALLAELDPPAADVQQSASEIRPAVVVPRTPTRARLPGPAALRRAAAIALLLLGGAFAVPPARAWMIERVRDVAAALGLVAPDSAPGTDAPAGAATGGGQAAAVRVTFEVRGDTFEIQAPAVGTLVVRRGAGSTGSAESAGAPGASLVVLPDGLRIEGATPAAAHYEVTLPASVAAVRVRAGAAAVTVHALPPAGEELRIDLVRR